MADIRIIPSTGLVNVTGSINFTSGGSTMLFMTGSSGNVGIGSASPAYKLDIVGTSRAAGMTLTGFATGTSGGNLELGFDGTHGVVQAYNRTSGWIPLYLSGVDVRFNPQGTETMRITSAGNVGIGTTGPSTKLEVGNFLDAVTNKITVAARYEYEPEFNFRLGQSGTNLDWIGAVISSGDDGNYNGKILFKTANAGRDTPTTKMIIKASGNVGIGTTTPLADGLTIRREGGDRKVLLRLDRPNTAGLQTALQFTVSDIMVGQIQHEYAASNLNHMSFTLRSVGGADIIPLWLQNSGNVGIGSTSPGKALDVVGDIRASTTVSASSGLHIKSDGSADSSWDALTFRGTTEWGDTSAYGVLGGDAGEGIMVRRPHIVWSSVQSDAAIRLGRSGGTSSGDWFGVGAGSSNVFFIRRQTSVNSIMEVDTSGNMVLGAGSNYLAVLQGGNVGISTTAPNNKLQVVGGVTATSFTGSLLGNASTATSATSATSASFASTAPYSGLTGTVPTWNQNTTGNAATATNVAWTGVTAGERTDYTLGFEAPASGYAGFYFSSPGNTEDAGYLLVRGGADVGIYTQNGITLVADTGWLTLAQRQTAGKGVRIMTGTTSTERLTVTAAGNVGIGTTSPSQVLHVNGSAYLESGNLFLTQGNHITWNSGDNFIKGISGYHLQFTTYDGSSAQVEVLRLTGGTAASGGARAGIGVSVPQAKLHVSGTADVFLAKGSGSASNTTIMAVDGNNGRLFEVSDDLSDSLFSVNTIAGLPVIEAFADYTVTMGSYNKSDLVVTGSKVGIGTPNPQRKLDVYDSGSQIVAQFSSSNASSVRIRFSDANTASENVNIGAIGTRMALWTNNTERLSILSGGNVGIGTTGPTARLHVSGGDAVLRNAFIGEVPTYGAENSQFSHISRAVAGEYSFLSANDGTTFINAKTGFDINFRINNSNVAVIKSSGNVGIGTTSPGFKLDVVGNARIGDNTAQLTHAALQASAGQGSAITYRDIDLKGSWAANEGHAITATHGSTSSNIVGQIVFEHNSPGSRIKFGRLYDAGDQSTYPIHMVSDGADGRIGIGTTAPNAQLNAFTTQGGSTIATTHGIGGTYPKASGISFGATSTSISVSNNGGTVVFTGGAGMYANNTAASNNPTELVLWTTSGGTPAARLTVDSSGTVGIGTTAPGTPLGAAFGLVIDGNTNNDVQIRLQNNSTGRTSADGGLLSISGTAMYLWNYENDALLFGTNNTERIRILSGGNVGIGTSSPSSLLHVAGTGKFTSTLFSDSRLQIGVNGSDQTYASIFIGGDLTTGTSQYALLLDPQLSGTSNYGVLANARIKASHAATNAYGVYIVNNEVLSGASIVNNYGLYIVNQTNGSSLNYALYSAGGTSYFAGNVGIGITNPTAKLYVKGNATDDIGLTVLENDYASGGIYFPTLSVINTRGNHSYGVVAEFRTNTAGDGDRPSILFYGEQAAHSWQIGQTTSDAGWGASDDFAIGYRASNDPTTFTDFPTAYLTVKTGGNVGIGTTSPGLKLDVVGGTTGQPVLRLQSTDVDGYTGAHLYSSAGTLVGHFGWANGTTTALSDKMYFGTIVNKPVVFTTNDTIRVRITAGGTLLVSGSVTPSEGPWKGTAVFGPDGQDKVIIGGLVSSYTGATIGGHNSALNAWGDLNIVGGNVIFRYQETEYARIETSGNVGIGTTSPGAKLHVAGTGTTFAHIQAGGGDYAYLRLSTPSSDSGYLIKNTTTANSALNKSLYLWNGDGPIQFVPNAVIANAVTVAVGGNVGIGTTSPAYKLQVNGNFNATDPMIDSAGTSNDNSVMQWRYGTSDAYRLRLKQTVTSGVVRWNFSQTNNNSDFNDVLVLDRGNVGIGTTSPATKLHVNGAGRFEGSVALGYGSAGEYSLEMGLGRTGNGFAYIDLIGDATYTDYGLRIIRGNGGADTTSTITHRGTGIFLIETNEAAPIVFNTTAAERMRILSGGNVGIGTTAPTNKLHINSTDDNAYALRVQGNTDNASGVWTGIGIAGEGSNTKTAIIFEDIGVSYSRGKLHFALNNSLDQTNATPANAVMTLTPGGNVGIGTTSPGYKLEVSGNSYFSGLTHFAQTATAGSAFRWGSFGTAVSPDTMLCMNQLWNGSGWTILDGNYGTTAINLGSAAASPTIRFETGGANTVATTKMIILNNGNVGIGTTAPAAKLEVTGGSDGDAMISMGSNSVSGILNAPANMYINADSDNGDANGVIAFGFNRTGFSGGAETIRLLENGNVGIGTTTPTVKLHVSGGGVRIQGSGDPNNSLRFDDTGGTSRNAMFVSSSNYLVVGNTNYAGIQLIHTGSAPGANNIDNGASRYYGTDQTYYLAEPNKWLAVRINSVNYVMPLYQV